MGMLQGTATYYNIHFFLIFDSVISDQIQHTNVMVN